MANLDNMSLYQQVDPKGMGDLIERFPAQVEEAWRIGQGVKVPPAYADVDNLVLQGMGGSAVGGDLLRTLYAGSLEIPALVVRDYRVPAFAGSRTLFIAASYSGNTEETLAGYAEARRRGCKILAVATGGELAARAGSDGNPCIAIPGGISPRAALGYSFFPLLAVLGWIGLLPDAAAEVGETLTLLQAGVAHYGRQVAESGNSAKELAKWFHGHYPLIYAAGAWPGMVAMRWKTQFNENAKNLAFWNSFPELNHNETVGYEAPAELVGRLRVLILRSGEENAVMKRRLAVTAEIINESGAQTREVEVAGVSALARMFGLIQLGDFVSYYLAALNGIDPTPIGVINRLKSELGKVKND